MNTLYASICTMQNRSERNTPYVPDAFVHRAMSKRENTDYNTPMHGRRDLVLILTHSFSIAVMSRLSLKATFKVEPPIRLDYD